MASYDLGTAQNLVNDYTSRRWGGRQLSDGNWSEIGSTVGYQPGAEINDDLLSGAYSAVDTMARRDQWAPSPGEWADTGVLPPVGSTGGNSTLQPGAVPPSTGSAVQTGQTQPSNPDLQSILSSPQNVQITPAQSAAQDAILQLLTRSQQGVTLSDPTIQPVADAYRSSRQRGLEQERRSLANRASATGTLSTGGFDTEVAGAQQGASRDVASFDANLVRSEMDTRREELLKAIELAETAGNNQQQSILKQQLALLDATVRQQDISLRDRLGTGDTDLRRMLGLGDLDVRNRTLGQSGELGRGDLGLRLLQSLLQNDQFFSGLGLNAAQLEAMLNQTAIQTMLGVR